MPKFDLTPDNEKFAGNTFVCLSCDKTSNFFHAGIRISQDGKEFDLWRPLCGCLFVMETFRNISIFYPHENYATSPFTDLVRDTHMVVTFDHNNGDTIIEIYSPSDIFSV